MTSQELPAMKENPKFIFFTDFDGTVTMQDSNDWMTDNFGFGAEKRREETARVFNGMPFRHAFAREMDSVNTPYNKCIKLLVENIELDPHFKNFFFWASQNNIPVVVLSSGMVPIIRALLKNLVGPESENIQVIANNVRAKEGKTFDDEDGWQLVFRDDSDFGHDKSLTLRQYAQLPEDIRPIMFYAGDGVSDLSAARESDLLFAKQGMDLVSYCAKENIPFTTFKDWSSIKSTVENIITGKESVHEAASKGYQKYRNSLEVSNDMVK